MKRFLFILISVLTIVLIPSCTKSEKSLVGTIWATNPDEDNVVYELCFYSQREVELSLSINNKIQETLYGTYEYDSPYVFCKFPNPEAISATFEASAKINGNKLEWDGGLIFIRR